MSEAQVGTIHDLLAECIACAGVFDVSTDYEADKADLENATQAVLDHVQALRDERDRLRKALRPFAEVGDVLDAREFVNLYERWGTSGKKHTISMQHLKHAAEVYGVTK